MPLVPPDHGCDGETVSISSIQLADLGGYLLVLLVDARFVGATLCQHSPSDPRHLIGECRCQNIVMQAFCGGREPRPEAVLCQFSGLSRITCSTRGSENLANVAHWRFQPLQGSVESMRAPPIVFAAIDVVPHLAAQETHQRSREFSVISEKGLFQ
jgi:hypothetical protein